MKDYAQLWLDYKEKRENKDCEELKRFTFSGADKEDVIVKNASAELTRGLAAMLSIEPVIVCADTAVPLEETDGEAIRDNDNAAGSDY